MEWLTLLAEEVLAKFTAVITFPLVSTQRVYWLYLLSALLIAAGVYALSAERRQHRSDGLGFIRGAIAFMFPASVWRHPSAWLDVRYFIPHQMVRLWIYGFTIAGTTVALQDWTLSGLQYVTGHTLLYALPPYHLLPVLSLAAISLIAADFVAFLVHYLQHKISFLWTFHKVHHSAEVLHPLTNYREHPVDNIAYAVAFGITVGCLMGVFQFAFGSLPREFGIPLLSVTFSVFIYNISGYNLRHSHIWLRWPGVLSKVFGSPAHHQIHHSCKPAHLNKNFGFMFPIWDILFGTYYLPDHPEEMDFGLADGTEKNYHSLVTLYTWPFIDLFQRENDRQH